MLSGRLALAVATEQLAVADDALALGTDVDEDLVLVDADDLTLDDVAVLEALDVGVLLGEELRHRGRLGAKLARGRGFVLIVAGCGRIGRLVVAQRVARGRSVGRLRGRRRRGRRRLLRLCLHGGRSTGACVPAASASASAPVPLVGPVPRPSDGAASASADAPSAVAVRRVLWRVRRILCAGCGLVCDGDGRRGVLGRPVGDGGHGLRLRRGPARLFFGQGVGHSSWWICSQESGTPRATLRAWSDTVRWSVVIDSPRSAPSCVDWACCRSSDVLPLGAGESLAHAFSRLQSPNRAGIARSDRGRRRPPCCTHRPADPLGDRSWTAGGARHARPSWTRSSDSDCCPSGGAASSC